MKTKLLSNFISVMSRKWKNYKTRMMNRTVLSRNSLPYSADECDADFIYKKFEQTQVNFVDMDSSCYKEIVYSYYSNDKIDVDCGSACMLFIEGKHILTVDPKELIRK